MAVKTLDFRKNTVGTSGSADTDRAPSPNIWYDCPPLQIIEERRLGLYFFDDFDVMPLKGTQTTQIAWDKYKVFADTSSSITPVHSVNSVDLTGGILDFLVDTTAHQAVLSPAYGSFRMSGLTTVDTKLWFECRIALGSIVTNHLGFAIGLAEVDAASFTYANGLPFTNNTGTAWTTTGGFIGFQRPTVNTTLASTAYTDRAAAFTAAGTGEVVGLTAFTFTKLGFRYDPLLGANCVRFYQDNVELTTKVSASAIAALTNINANSMHIFMDVVGGSAASSDHVYLDWWRVAQVPLGYTT